MYYRKPDYFDKFACIGGRCQDTCCAGWEIEVDEASAKRFRQLQGPLKEKIRRFMTETEEETYFSLVHGKCPFLNEQGLCDMILEEGEDILCDICREHPRFYNWYADRTEKGIGMCCEEAERLIFSDSSKASFIEEKEEEEESDISEDEAGLTDLFAWLRTGLIGLAQKRSEPLGKRLIALLEAASFLQDLLDEEDLEGMAVISEKLTEEADENSHADLAGIFDRLTVGLSYADPEKEEGSEEDFSYTAVLDPFLQLESLDPNWPKLIRELQSLEELSDLAKEFSRAYPQAEWEYEHVLVYYLNRYLLEALYDMDLLSKVKFCILPLFVCRFLELNDLRKEIIRTELSRDRIFRLYSKEIEYCPENVAGLLKLSWDMDCLGTEELEKEAVLLMPF